VSGVGGSANHALNADVIAALNYWPDAVVAGRAGRERPPDPVDLGVLPPFFNGVLRDLPWWNRDWKVTRVEPGSTIHMVRSGHLNPHLVLVKEIAAVLGNPEDDLAAIAGLG
jgi:hypothetical protein